MKNIKVITSLFSVLLIIVGVLIFTPLLENDTKTHISEFAGIFITGIGFIVAISQFRFSLKQYIDDLIRKNKDFLDLSINTKMENEFYSIKTQVFNKSGEPKKIDFSFILITEQSEGAVNKVNELLNAQNTKIKIPNPNGLSILKKYIDMPFFLNNSIGIIPLKFYYEENCQIGNENPSYTYTFTNQESILKKGIYSARFFIFTDGKLHRCTTDSLIIR